MIVSTCGFGSTGSSVVTDYLSECDDCDVFDKIELDLIIMPDGIEDLEYHLVKANTRQYSSIYAIQRFREYIRKNEKRWVMKTAITKEQLWSLTDEYLDQLVQLRYLGNSPFVGHSFKAGCSILYRKAYVQHYVLPREKAGKISKIREYPCFGEMEVSIRPENFYEATQQYLCRLLTAMGADCTKKLILDQAFCGNDPVKSFPFFEDPYAIVVDRDPRDIYIFAHKVLKTRARFMPLNDVEKFIVYYKILRENQPYKLDHPRVLRLSFEEMVYDYDRAAKKIDDFLHVENHRRQTVFKPEMSVVNTNLKARFPEFSEDVKRIEESLPEYLFAFEKYDAPEGNGQMFFGRSHLNRK